VLALADKPDGSGALEPLATYQLFDTQTTGKAVILPS